MIEIQFNGQTTQVTDGCTITELLQRNEIKDGHFIVVLNDELVVKTDYDTTVIASNDAVDIMSPITGG